MASNPPNSPICQSRISFLTMKSLLLPLRLLLPSLALGQVCFEEGVCLNSFLITEGKEIDSNDCLFACQDLQDPNYVCQWFSYSPISQVGQTLFI